MVEIIYRKCLGPRLGLGRYTRNVGHQFYLIFTVSLADKYFETSNTWEKLTEENLMIKNVESH